MPWMHPNVLIRLGSTRPRLIHDGKLSTQFLTSAATEGQVEFVREWLTSHPEHVNVYDFQSSTWLMRCVMENDYDEPQLHARRAARGPFAGPRV